jgi:hypothetical protein
VLCSLRLARCSSVAADSTWAASIAPFGPHNPSRRRCGRFSGPEDATPPNRRPLLSPSGSQTHPPRGGSPNHRGSRFRRDPGSTDLPASCTRRAANWSDSSRPHPNSRAQLRPAPVPSSIIDQRHNAGHLAALALRDWPSL